LSIKHILSILLLSVGLFCSNIEVVESFGGEDNAVIKNSETTEIAKPVEVTKSVKEQNISKADFADTKEKNITKKQVAKTKKPSSKNKSLKTVKKSLKSIKKSKSAKLVIIIDDVSHRYQLNLIKALPFKVTPSIFPPSKMNMHSQTLARGLKHFMVHLPLESHSRAMNKMHKTIFTTFTQKQIDNRIKEIRRLFPTAKYINNHTGSKFTSNYTASKRLYKSLIKRGFIFVDSRTSMKTKIPKIAREFNRRYLKNDFFLDNTISTPAIKRQIRKAVNYAKKYGLAVVIGHPHPQTFRALRESKKLIQSVRTLYIDEL